MSIVSNKKFQIFKNFFQNTNDIRKNSSEISLEFLIYFIILTKIYQFELSIIIFMFVFNQ